MTLSTEVHEAQIRALEAKKACPRPGCVDGKELYIERDKGREIECYTCKDSTRVPVLDAENKWGLRANLHSVGASCLDGCLGYTPSDSEGAWMQAAADIGYESQYFRCGTRLNGSFFVQMSLSSMDREFESQPENTHIEALVFVIAEAVLALAQESE